MWIFFGQPNAGITALRQIVLYWMTIIFNRLVIITHGHHSILYNSSGHVPGHYDLLGFLGQHHEVDKEGLGISIVLLGLLSWSRSIRFDTRLYAG